MIASICKAQQTSFPFPEVLTVEEAFSVFAYKEFDTVPPSCASPGFRCW